MKKVIVPLKLQVKEAVRLIGSVIFSQDQILDPLAPLPDQNIFIDFLADVNHFKKRFLLPS